MIQLPLLGTDKNVTINPTKIIAVGLNYRDHVKESLTFSNKPQDIPAEPVLFAKTPNVLTGPGQPIVIPAHIKDYAFPDARIDHECELAIIIGKKGRHIREENAFEHVLGYTCFNDVSQRNIQRSDPSGWFRGKSFDTFGPIGPAVLPHGDIGPPGIEHLLPGKRRGKAVVKYRRHDFHHPGADSLYFQAVYPGRRGHYRHRYARRGKPHCTGGYRRSRN